MKKILISAAIALAAVSALTGCGHTERPDVTTQKQTQAPVVDHDSEFVNSLRSTAPDFNDGSASQLIKLGHLTCNLFESEGFDAGMADTISLAVQNGFTARDAGAMAGASVVSYCPQFTYDARDWVEANR